MSARSLSIITGGLTLLMALFSFILSFNALADLAATHKVSIPPLFPLIVEAGVVIFSLNALYRSLHGEPAKAQWALIITSSLLAGSFNVLHAAPDVISRIMAAMPSLFLLLSFETFVGQIKHAVKHNAQVKSIADLAQEFDAKHRDFEKMIADKEEEITKVNAELDKLTGQIEQKQKQLDTLLADMKSAKTSKITDFANTMQQAKQQAIEERRAQVLTLLQAGNSDKDIAMQLGRDIRTIRADIVALNGKASEVTR